MTTITIKNGNLKKTSFEDLEEVLDYLIDNQSYGVLHPLNNSEINTEQEKRFKKALIIDKSKMKNI